MTHTITDTGQQTKWFLFCEDAHSNEVVSRTILETQGAVTDFKWRLCADGNKRPLYEVPDYQFANRLWKSQKQLAAKLQIFTSRNEEQPKAWAKIIKKKKPLLKTIKERSDAIKKGALRY
jgi:hypothetical protein